MTHSSHLERASRFDLHMHSNRSDGRFEIDEVLTRCARGGLEVIALTDHDLASDPEVCGPHLIGGQRLWVLGGAEVSGTHEGAEYHLLVYFKGAAPAGFLAFCQAQSQARARRYEAAVHNLALHGLDLPDDDAREGGRALTRLHLAQALVEAGHAKHIRDAFRRFLSHTHGKVPACELSFVDAIRVARGLGGITSWAHPPVAAVKQHLPTFIQAGLQGLEGLRPFLTSKDRNFFRRTARRHELFLTGGSDFHGWYHEDLGLFYAERPQLDGFLEALLAA